MIEIKCPNAGCGYAGSVDEGKLGTRVVCRKCGTSFLVTREGAKDAKLSTPSSGGNAGGGASPRAAAAGEVIGGRYRVEKLLGQGGMGEVWLAADTSLHNRPVAIKRVLQQMSGEQALQRFEREVKALAGLNHPHIVTVHDAGHDARGLYYVMEFIHGASLREWLQKQGETMPPMQQLLDLFKQILRGVAFAHAKGIVHRDLKPENVIVTDDGIAKVLDFGLAKLALESSVTQPQQRLGTPLYMAPEQWRGAPCDARTDVYSLGAMLFELCTLQTPFEGDNILALNYQHQNTDPPNPRSYRAELPDPVNVAILKALEKNQKNRYASAKELLSAVEQTASSVPVPPLLPSTPSISKRSSEQMPEGCLTVLQVPNALCIALTPDQKSIVIGYGDGRIELRRLDSGEIVGSSTPYWGQISDLVCFPDGDRVLSTSYGLGLPLRGSVAATQLTDFKYTTSPETNGLCLRCAILRGGQRIAIAWNNELQIRNAQTFELIRSMTGDTQEISSLASCQEPNWVVAGGHNGTIDVWDVNTGAQVHHLKGGASRVSGLAISRDDSTLISVASELTVWDLKNGTVRSVLDSPDRMFFDVNIFPDGYHAVSGSVSGPKPSEGDGVIRIWSLNAGNCIHTFTHVKNGLVSKVRVTSDGKRVVSLSDGLNVCRSIRVWDVSDIVQQASRGPIAESTPGVGLGDRLRRLREEGERRRAELEAAERQRKEEEFELLQVTLAEQLDREAFDEAWKTVGELRKLKPDDVDVQEAAKLIAEHMGHRGGGSVLVLPGGVTMEFVPIPPATFLMGSPDNEPGRQPNEGPQHQVTITYPFWLGKYPVTQAQWHAVMGTSVTDKRNKTGNLSLALAGEGPEHPMYYVSWYECQEFVQKVNALSQGAFRLPSEAEWEYACRAGTQTRFSFGDNEAQLGEHSWYEANSGKQTHPVGQKQPNAWGLYDVHGNVWEWCQDWWHDSYNGAPPDGSAWEAPWDQYRVVRGGSWGCTPVYCRAENRMCYRPDLQQYFLGFRLLRTDSSTAHIHRSAVVSQPERPRIEIVSNAPKPPEPSRKEFLLELPGEVTMEFVPIPPGTFLMGSPDNEPGRQPNEGPQHQVTIAYPFWLGKYPVTQAQWQAVMGTSVMDQRNKASLNVIAGVGPQHPMYFVSWPETQEFLQKVSAMGQGVYRLPSEAEWEYACRAGAQTRYHFGDSDADLAKYEWYAANSGQTTHPVGQKKPNAWGLYDLHGNILEWCHDYGHATYIGAPTDGSAWETPSSQYRVLRGGVWNMYQSYCRVSHRLDAIFENWRSTDVGFRLLRMDSVAYGDARR